MFRIICYMPKQLYYEYRIERKILQFCVLQNLKRKKVISELLFEKFQLFLVIFFCCLTLAIGLFIEDLLTNLLGTVDFCFNDKFDLNLLAPTPINILNIVLFLVCIPLDAIRHILISIVCSFFPAFFIVLLFSFFELILHILMLYNKKNKIKKTILILYRVEVLRHRRMLLLFGLLVIQPKSSETRISLIKKTHKDIIKLNKKYIRIYHRLSTIDKLLVSEIIYLKLKPSISFSLPHYLSLKKKKTKPK